MNIISLYYIYFYVVVIAFYYAIWSDIEISEKHLNRFLLLLIYLFIFKH